MAAIDLRAPGADELDEIRGLATPLRDTGDLDGLVEAVADRRVVLLGEASHGTSDYYRWRAELTKRLVAEHGFSFVAVEGDWPSCFELNRWVKGRADQDRRVTDVLRGFERWPTWMWANEEVADFAGWLREHNLAEGVERGFYGLDVYSLWESLDRIVRFVADQEPELIDAALDAWRCFQPYGDDPQQYARATRMVSERCEDEVVELLGELHRRPLALDDDPEVELDALQNAEVLGGAERYYRTMVRGDGESWNVRDTHMADTLDRLLEHHGAGAKAIVWAHNTHVGDARATPMAGAGMVNIGELARHRFGPDAVALVGFAGHRGSVIAGGRWGAPMEVMAVPPAVEGSHEHLLETALAAPSVLVFPDERDTPWLGARRGHRAIGVVYDPLTDPWGNWVPTVMGRRYDALVSFADTEALHPLALAAAGREMETMPWAT